MVTAPPSRATDRLLREIGDCFAVLVAPRETSRRLAGRDPVLAPWLLVSAGSAVLSFFVVSLAQRASAHLLADVPDPDLVETVTRQIAAMQWIGVAGAPVAVFARWIAAAGLLWSIATLTGWNVAFRATLSVVAFAGVPDLLGRAVDLGVAWTEGPEFTTGLVPLATSATSLAALVPIDGGRWATALLDRLSPFSLWSVALWTVGFQERLGGSLLRSLAVCVPVWVTFAVMSAAAAILRGSAPGMAGLGLPAG
jgi:hypothetical protein